jgi:lipopolysaccharide heptosyltransferase I
VSQGSTHRFLIVRLGSLGDVVHGIPVAAALRDRFPMARIDWMVDPRYVELVSLVKGLDSPIPVNPRRHPLAMLSTIRTLRHVEYTAVIDLQGLMKSGVLARATGAWRTIGFPREHLREPSARMFYSDMPDPGAATHVVFKGLALLTPLGVRETRPSFPLELPYSTLVEDVRAHFGPSGYVLINPGAAWPNKRWPADRFGALARRLHASGGIRSLVLWGPGEQELASAVVEAAAGAADLAPQTTITEILSVARAARVVVSGDTGPLHLAAAVGAPVVALFGPTRTERNGPWSASDITISRTAQCSCLYARKCRKRERCIDDIAVEEVVAAVERVLEPND